MSDIKFDHTGRGFSVITFDDYYDHACSLQKSSLAGPQAIWLGLENAGPTIMASDARKLGREDLCKEGETTGWVPWPIPEEVSLSTRMHLSQEQVAELLPLLQHFVKHGELPPSAPPGPKVKSPHVKKLLDARPDLWSAFTERELSGPDEEHALLLKLGEGHWETQWGTDWISFEHTDGRRASVNKYGVPTIKIYAAREVGKPSPLVAEITGEEHEYMEDLAHWAYWQLVDRDEKGKSDV